MTTRLIDNAKDSATIQPWWDDRRGFPFPAGALPPVGVIAEDETGPVAAVWLFMAVGVGVAWMAFQCTNPAASAASKLNGLRRCVESLECVAVAHDYHIVMTESYTIGMGRLWGRLGYRVNHERVTQFLKQI